MERTKQIEERAKYHASHRPDEVQKVVAYTGFTLGAEWADANPSEDTIMEIIEAYKLWVSEFYTMPLTEFVVKWLKRNER